MGVLGCDHREDEAVGPYAGATTLASRPVQNFYLGTLARSNFGRAPDLVHQQPGHLACRDLGQRDRLAAQVVGAVR
jgi:hypothetical protein